MKEIKAQYLKIVHHSLNAKSRINNTGIDTAQGIDIVMPMNNLIECSGNYLKTSRSLWQYYKDEPNDNITQSELFKSKIKTTGKTLWRVIQKMLK